MCGIVTDACRAVHISPRTAYRARKQALQARAEGVAAAPDFASEWEEAIAESMDRLEDEALRRARDGYGAPIFYRGHPLGDVTRYSDGLLMFLLKAHRPEKYREGFENREMPPGTRALLEKYYAAIGAEAKK